MMDYADYGQPSYGGGGGGGGVHQQQQAPHSPHRHYSQEDEHHEQHGQEATPSMTIDEMRILHHTALAEAEAKRTELRLVLASRYRELVGSSDEVIHMRERAEELNDLVVALPGLVERVARSSAEVTASSSEGMAGGGGGGGGDMGPVSAKLFPEEEEGRDKACRSSSASSLVVIEAARAEISRLPRAVHRRLDENDVHGAAAALIELFDVISSRSDSFPLATALSSSSPRSGGERERQQIAVPNDDDEADDGDERLHRRRQRAMLETQMKMAFLHVQTLPARTVRMARKVLLRSAARPGARSSAAALSALDLLDVDNRRWEEKQKREGASSSAMATDPSSSRAAGLIDLYYESKARLLDRLLGRLHASAAPKDTGGSSSVVDAAAVTNAAESVLSRIVSILQHDVILHPFQIFVLRKFPVVVAAAGGDREGGRARTTEEEEAERLIVESIMSTLPPFDPDLLKSKASRFLAAHLPLIRAKVKSVLVVIAGTTASKLGQIRQTLYDKTDGAECTAALDDNGVCTWDEAVAGMVDVRVVSHGAAFAAPTTTNATNGRSGSSSGDGATSPNANANNAAATATAARRFSLWGALFSNTFSSLVHSLLTSSFSSVHVRVVSTLRASLARAPPHGRMLPHEARQNALRIATDLDASLRRTSDDAHELLVHAEEREESERRLRQSLYVQTCEIMGRLLNELRRMLVVVDADRRQHRRGDGDGRDDGEEGREGEERDATKVLIVGRLCHLLKFRLRTLPTLLDPKSSPAVLSATASGGGNGGGGAAKSSSYGMITLTELNGSFDLADDDDDGLISFDEAMEAMESAFSGTHFHGAEMVRDTLLLSSSGAAGHAGGVPDDDRAPASSETFAPDGSPLRRSSAPRNVTLSELALLSARGLRHDASGPESALGTVQSSLDDIVRRCFMEWARAALAPPSRSFATTARERAGVAARASNAEWRRLGGLLGANGSGGGGEYDDALLREIGESNGEYAGEANAAVVGEVSPHVVSYLLAVAGVLNRSVCPADSLPPVPSAEYAEALGISASNNGKGTTTPNMMVLIRGSLLGEALSSMSKSLKQEILPTPANEDEDGGAINDDEDDFLKKCSTSSLIQLAMDVQFIHRCFFERNQHGFLMSERSGNSSSVVDDSRVIIEGLSERLTVCMNNSLKDDGSLTPAAVSSAISERHSRVFASCDLFLSSLLGEKGENDISSDVSNGVGVGVSSSSQSFVLNPLPSSRRFVLLPIQAEKSLAELQLRSGKYGKKQDEKASSKDVSSGNALGSGFGFLSSMLNKTR